MTPLTGLSSSLPTRFTNDTGTAAARRSPSTPPPTDSATSGAPTGAAARTELGAAAVVPATSSALAAFEAEPLGALASQSGVDAARVYRLLQDV